MVGTVPRPFGGVGMLPRRSAVDVLSFITPPNIALAVLLRLYAEQNAGDASDAWLHLALYLVEEVKSADQCYEKPIDEIYDDIRGLDDSGDVEAGLQAALGELQSPDDLFTFLHELQHLLTEEVEQVVESDSGPAPLGAGKRLFFPDVNRFCMALVWASRALNSQKRRFPARAVLGIFTRKVALGFNSLPFERFCDLYERFVQYQRGGHALDSSAALTEGELDDSAAWTVRAAQGRLSGLRVSL